MLNILGDNLVSRTTAITPNGKEIPKPIEGNADWVFSRVTAKLEALVKDPENNPTAKRISI